MPIWERRPDMAKILVVDDDPELRDLAAMLLYNIDGNIVIQANDGTEAQKNIQAIVPDLVITDFNMPGMTGIELIRWIKSKYPSIPVILMSNQDIISHPADVFVSKLQLFDKLHIFAMQLLNRNEKPA